MREAGETPNWMEIGLGVFCVFATLAGWEVAIDSAASDQMTRVRSAQLLPSGRRKTDDGA